MQLDGIAALIFIFLLFAIPISLVAFVVSKFAKIVHRRKKLTENLVLTEYEAPAELSPAEIGFLFDSNIGKRELVATLLHLEQRGLVHLEYVNFGGVYANKTHRFDNKPLKPHEKLLLDLLAERENVRMLSLQKLSDFNTAVADSLHEQGFIRHKSETLRHYIKRIVVAYIAINLWLYYIFLKSADNFFVELFILTVLITVFSPFFIALALIATFIYNKIVGFPGLIPKKLKRLWPSIEGFRDYVKKVELDRIQFESEELKAKSKNKTLPYAVALNMDTSWQDRFK